MDYWDSDTLAYFLDEYPGYDATVMFYSMGDRNSHAFAPYYGRIGEVLEAGTTQSRLVMALFDCEDSISNSQLCEAVGVTHYPTIMFIGSGPYHDTDPLFGRLFTGQYGHAPVPNTVKFQGNWQYPDSILDWIRTMQALSNWHTWTTKGFGKRLRNILLPHKKPRNTPLPIGLPASAAAKSSGSHATPASSSYDSEYLESMVEILSNRTSDLEKLVERSSTLLDSVLMQSSSQDMFEYLDQSKAWDSPETNAPLDEILRNCVLELTMDYCQRVGAKAVQDVIDEMEGKGMTMEQIAKIEGLDEVLVSRIAQEEPYCSILDDCFMSGMVEEKCRPKLCPFQNQMACSYLTSCLEPSLQLEYAEALGLNLSGEPVVSDASSSDGGGEKKRGWF